MAVQGLQSTEFSLMCIYMNMFVIDSGIAQMCGSKQSHVIKNCNREISDLEDVHLNFNDGDLYDNCICTLKSQRSGKLKIRDLFPRSQDCSTGIRFTTTSTGGTQEKTFNCTESIVENITLDTKGSLSIQLVRFRGGRNGSDDFYYCFMISKREGIETFTVSCQLSDETPANTKRDVEDSNALVIALLCGNGVLIGVIAGVVVLLRRNRNKNTRRTSPEKKPRPTQLANNSDQTGYSKSTDIYGLKDNPLYQPADDIQHYTYIDTSLNTLQKPAIISDQSQNSKETSRSIPTHSVQQNGSSSNEEDGLKGVTLYQPDDDNHTYTYIDTEMITSRGPHCLT